MRNYGEVYWHVGNSGVTFQVGDAGNGPELHISSGAFGNLIAKHEIQTTAPSLRALGLMLVEASDEQYSKPGYHPAVYSQPGRRKQATAGAATAESPEGQDLPLRQEPSFLMHGPDEGYAPTVTRGAFCILRASAVFAESDGDSMPEREFQFAASLHVSELTWLYHIGVIGYLEGLITWKGGRLLEVKLLPPVQDNEAGLPRRKVVHARSAQQTAQGPAQAEGNQGVGDGKKKPRGTA